MKEPKAKKPKGWYSAAARAQRVALQKKQREARQVADRRRRPAPTQTSAAKRYAKETERLNSREAARRTMIGLIDIEYGHDTEDARWVQARLQRVAETKRRRHAAGGKVLPRKKAPPVPRDEAALIRTLDAMGHRHCLHKDEYGRLRLAVGFDGRIVNFELGARTVTGEQAAQVRDCSRDTIIAMEARGKLSYAHVLAADEYRKAIEAMSSVGIRSVDFGERVDSSRTASTVPEHAINRAYSLRRLHERMNAAQRVLMLLVVVQGYTLEMVNRLGYGRLQTLSDEMRAALEIAATHYHIRADAQRPRSTAYS